jgi:hypothetical protein
MPNVVDLCNEALANIGDGANVASIDPPDGSAQADHCKRFYPIARDTVLEMHDWGFATLRATLAPVDFAFAQWQFAYAFPNLALRVHAILDPAATDDYSEPTAYDFSPFGIPQLLQGVYTPQTFAIETDPATGNKIILTNQENAIARYTQLVTDTTKFTPLFCQALVAFLSSKLAGPIIKGDEGRKAAITWLQLAQSYVAKAAMSDANQRRSDITHRVPWMAKR